MVVETCPSDGEVICLPLDGRMTAADSCQDHCPEFFSLLRLFNMSVQSPTRIKLFHSRFLVIRLAHGKNGWRAARLVASCSGGMVVFGVALLVGCRYSVAVREDAVINHAIRMMSARRRNNISWNH